MPMIPRRHRPFWDLERWLEEIPEWPEKLWPRIAPRIPMLRAPRMDIYETDDKVIAEIELPGVDPKNIEVEVKDNVLKVEAKAEEKKEEKKRGYFRKEISAGYYRRAIPLPVEVVGEKAEADYSEGMLKVTIPKVKPAKKEEKKPIKIKVEGTEQA